MNIITKATDIMTLTPAWLLGRHAECEVGLVMVGVDALATSFGGHTAK